MPVDRLSPLDNSFLAAETPTAHMHVGWMAVFEPPEDGSPPPDFAELRAHVAARLDRAPRYLQRLQPVPLGLHAPAWIDDPDFDIDRHLRHSVARDLGDIADAVFSEPLPRDRPLWQIWVADRLDDGRLGLVGKMHHCMVDGLAAVELAAMLLDPDPGRPALPVPLGRRHAAPRGDPAGVLALGVVDRFADQAAAAVRALNDPLALPRATGRFARTLAVSALPPAPRSPLNAATSPRRHLARALRPLEDLRGVGSRWGTTVNDVLLAGVSGALGRFLDGGPPLRAMVPVSRRPSPAGGARRRGERFEGNAVSFLLVDLPCQEPDPVVRLMQVHRQTAAAKLARDAEVADGAVRALGLAPRRVQRAVAGLVSSRRLFNLTVSNIPGPPVPLFLRGARLGAAWPVVPLAGSHAVSIGMTTVAGDACFGVYADPATVPDADRLAELLGEAVDELVASS